ncbi:MAG TPA: GatB/YqeY domain-containing protein [Candidatus Paceibacterota bacterium]|nr:GatB/YqeY domain-containing protein [Candidatus Paceibacterota bacterium]
MTIHETIKKGIPEAMRAKDTARLTVLRSLSAALTNEAVAKKLGPDALLADEDALAVLKRAANQRKDSIEQFEGAGRADLASPEKAELAIIEGYLPAMMPRAEVETAVKAKMAELGISAKAESGKLIGALMKDLKGKADGGDVKAAVDSLLV